MKIDTIKEHIWNIARPVHSPLTRALRKRFGRNYFEHPEMELPPAYEALQLEVERRLHRYLQIAAEEIEQITIVGANEGSEIPRFRRTYPRSRFLCFEPSPEWHAKLARRFSGCDFVEIRQKALGESSGTATFYELPLAGNGSLLAPDLDRWAQFTNANRKDVTTFQVEVSSLDKEAAGVGKIDLLWMDVQGAEGLVLTGGRETMRRVSAVFLEVALVESPYRGAALFSQVSNVLKEFGFCCVGLGLDSANFTGNALWLRLPAIS